MSNPAEGLRQCCFKSHVHPLKHINDLDENVTNFFKVLRDYPTEFIRLLELTPWSRKEYLECTVKTGNPIEDARRFAVICWMSISQSYRRSDSGCHLAHDVRKYYSLTNFTFPDGEQLQSISNRFKSVQIECLPAIECIKKYDNDGALIYFDPPYVKSTRSAKETYMIEWEDEHHEEAAEFLHDSQGMVVVSGYQNTIYERLYERYGWQRVDRESQVNGGDKRVESLWLSPRTSAGLRCNNRLHATGKGGEQNWLFN